MDAKNKKKFNYKKLILSNNYLYSSEEEQEKQKEEEKKKKKRKKTTDLNEFNESIIEKETSITRELFNKHFHYQTPSALLKELYKTNDKEKNSLLVRVINSGLND